MQENRSRPLPGVREEDEQSSSDEDEKEATTSEIQVTSIDASVHNDTALEAAFHPEEEKEEPMFRARHVERETALQWWANALAIRKIKISKGMWKRIHQEVPSQSSPDVSDFLHAPDWTL